MENNEKIIEDACRLIADSLGQATAEEFRKFYKSQNRDTIILSVNELLNDLVGPENAQKQIQGKF